MSQTVMAYALSVRSLQNLIGSSIEPESLDLVGFLY